MNWVEAKTLEEEIEDINYDDNFPYLGRSSLNEEEQIISSSSSKKEQIISSSSNQEISAEDIIRNYDELSQNYDSLDAFGYIKKEIENYLNSKYIDKDGLELLLNYFPIKIPMDEDLKKKFKEILEESYKDLLKNYDYLKGGKRRYKIRYTEI